MPGFALARRCCESEFAAAGLRHDHRHVLDSTTGSSRSARPDRKSYERMIDLVSYGLSVPSPYEGAWDLPRDRRRCLEPPTRHRHRVSARVAVG